MAEVGARQHDVLIVSSSDKFNSSVTRALSDGRYRVLELRKSASLAKRELNDRSYDAIVINMPLSDEQGLDLAIDTAKKYASGVVVIAPNEISEDIAEQVIDYGVLTIAKPATKKAVSRSLRLMCALCDKLKSTEKKVVKLEDKMAEIRIVNRAKWHLIDKEGMSEEDAHRFIEKVAMDKCITKREVAEEILG